MLSKIDLVNKEEVEALMDKIRQRIPEIKTIAISNETEQGLEEIKQEMLPYHSYCFIGSSGVGKSTLVNHLKEEEILKTSSISESTNKGKHTTSHRELLVLPNQSIVIDTPGMRELGITDQSDGIETTYDQITQLVDKCRFADCTHTNESGCAVLDALENGELSHEVYENYQKLKREQEHFSASIHEKRKKDKEFGKMVRTVKDLKKRYK